MVADARSFCPAAGDPYGAMQFKNALNRQYEIAEAFAWYCDMLGLPSGATLREKTIVGLRAYAEARAGVYREVFPSGAPFRIAQPQIEGQGGDGPATYTTRAFFVACLDDVTVRGCSDILEVDGAVLVDAEAREMADVRDNLEVDPAVFLTREATAHVIVGAHERLELDEAFVSLLGTASRAFGHWLWQYLPKYLTAVASGLLPRVPILIDEAMPFQHRETLAFLVGDDVPVVALRADQMAAVKRAWCAPMIAYVPLYEDIGPLYPHYTTVPPERFAQTVAIMRAAAAKTPATGSKRIFLYRKPDGRHDLANAEQLREMLEERGFDTIYPGDLRFEEQAALAFHADYIVAVEGSALLLCLLARPGAKVCILHQDAVIGETIGIAAVFEAAGLDVRLFTGRVTGIPAVGYPVFANFEIDAHAFGAFVDRWTARR